MEYIEKIKPNLFSKNEFKNLTLISQNIFKDEYKYNSDLNENEVVHSYKISVILKDIISGSSINNDLLVTSSTKSKISILKKLKKGAFYGLKISNLNLSEKATSCLKNNNILFISELLEIKEDELLGIKSLGRHLVKEINQKLDTFVVDYLFSEMIDCNYHDDRIAEINISDNFRSCIEQTIYLNKSLVSDNELSNEENKIIERCSQATEDISIELCSEAYLNPQKIIPIRNSLQNFILFTEKSKDNLTLLKDDIDKICESNRNYLLSSCLMAYTGDSQLSDELSTFFKGCEYVYDINSRVNYLSLLPEENILKIIKFLNWLQVEFDEILDKIFVEVCSNSRIMEILKCRAKNETFETIGCKFYVTRERIRQIEKKAIIKFAEVDKKERILWHISSILNGKTTINKSEIQGFSAERGLILVYLLSSVQNTYYTFNKNLNTFNLNTNESIELYKYIDEISI